tara:strand:+ start:751 stop:1185 length:435 start_codon:yes stop_codon:yes gene_type:complete
MEEEFYASIKLVSGEEVICLMMIDDSNPDDPLLVLQDPVTVSFEQRGHHTNVRVEPWLKTTTENFYFVRLSKVITMTELFDPEMIDFYKDFLESKEEFLDELDSDEPTKNVSRKMGFLGSVQETKKNLEDIYKINFEDSDNKDS